MLYLNSQTLYKILTWPSVQTASADYEMEDQATIQRPYPVWRPIKLIIT